MRHPRRQGVFMGSFGNCAVFLAPSEERFGDKQVQLLLRKVQILPRGDPILNRSMPTLAIDSGRSTRSRPGSL